MIRRVYIPVHGDPSVLEVRTVPQEPLAPEEVRIRVRAAGVNFADLMMRMGLYPEAPPRPFVPGYEVAGTVAELSPEASSARPALREGDRVLAVTRFGGYAEEVAVPAGKVFPFPESWSFEEAAAFPVGFLTAWIGLREMARVREGDRVLVHAAAGGLGLAAIQIARARGARVAGVCGGSAKAAAVRDQGAELAVDYRSEDVGTSVRRWAPGGVDVVMESRGGRRLRESLGLLAPAGRVVTYGVSEAVGGTRKRLWTTLRSILPMLWLNPLKLVEANAGVFGLNVLRLWEEDELLDRVASELMAGAREGIYRAVLDRTFPLESAAEAHRHIHERRNIGKVVLTVP